MTNTVIPSEARNLLFRSHKSRSLVATLLGMTDSNPHLAEHALEGYLCPAEAWQDDGPMVARGRGEERRQSDDFGVAGGIGERVVVLLERRTVDPDALREDLLDERAKRRMASA